MLAAMEAMVGTVPGKEEQARYGVVQNRPSHNGVPLAALDDEDDEVIHATDVVEMDYEHIPCIEDEHWI